MSKTYYEILEISINATQEEIKQAFKNLAKKYHPDNNHDNEKEANKKMQEITEAYVTLSDLQKRIKYDNELKEKGKYKDFSKESKTYTPKNNSGRKSMFYHSKSFYESYTKTTEENEEDFAEYMKEYLKRYREYQDLTEKYGYKIPELKELVNKMSIQASIFEFLLEYSPAKDNNLNNNSTKKRYRRF